MNCLIILLTIKKNKNKDKQKNYSNNEIPSHRSHCIKGLYHNKRNLALHIITKKAQQLKYNKHITNPIKSTNFRHIKKDRNKN